jgi:hypothetical protein
MAVSPGDTYLRLRYLCTTDTYALDSHTYLWYGTHVFGANTVSFAKTVRLPSRGEGLMTLDSATNMGQGTKIK